MRHTTVLGCTSLLMFASCAGVSGYRLTSCDGFIELDGGAQAFIRHRVYDLPDKSAITTCQFMSADGQANATGFEMYNPGTEGAVSGMCNAPFGLDKYHSPRYVMFTSKNRSTALMYFMGAGEPDGRARFSIECKHFMPL